MVTPGGGNKILERQVFGTGELIFRKGDKGNCAYLIQQGSVRVFNGEGKSQVTLAYFGPGEIIGEMALFYEENERTANVEAQEPTTLIEITSTTLTNKMNSSDPTIRALMSMLTHRMIQNNEVMLKQKIHFSKMEDLVHDLEESIKSGIPLETVDDFREVVFPHIQNLIHALEDMRNDSDMN